MRCKCFEVTLPLQSVQHQPAGPTKVPPKFAAGRRGTPAEALLPEAQQVLIGVVLPM